MAKIHLNGFTLTQLAIRQDSIGNIFFVVMDSGYYVRFFHRFFIVEGLRFCFLDAGHPSNRLSFHPPTCPLTRLFAPLPPLLTYISAMSLFTAFFDSKKARPSGRVLSRATSM